MLIKLEKTIDKSMDMLGTLTAILLLIMLINVFLDASMRYLINSSSIAMQEMEWHLFSAVFLFGVSYTLKEDGHVRVDMFYERMSVRNRSIINMVGAVIFMLPFSYFIISGGYLFTHEAMLLNEGSGDPGGLPYRWIVKSLIPLSFLLFIVAIFGFFLHNLNKFLGKEDDVHHSIAETELKELLAKHKKEGK